MKTPYSFKEKIKKGKVTNEILIDCIYAADTKYAKNHQKYEGLATYYRIYFWLEDNYHRVAKYRNLSSKFFKIKKDLLKNFKPKCIVNKIDRFMGDCEFYFYYDLGKYVFFLPTDNIDDTGLDIVLYEDLDRKENQDDDFLSTQFITKVHTLFMNNELTIEK